MRPAQAGSVTNKQTIRERRSTIIHTYRFDHPRVWGPTAGVTRKSDRHASVLDEFQKTTYTCLSEL